MKGKNILLSVENFYPRLGGGEVFVDELMCEFARENNVFVLYAGEKKESPLNLMPVSKSFVWKNIPLFNKTKIRQYYANKKWKKHLENFLDKQKIDIIFTQLEYVPSTIEIAKKKNIPVVVFIQNYDHFCPFLFFGKDPLSCSRNCFSCSPLAYKLQNQFSMKLMNWHGQMLKKADLIFSDSDYCRKVLKRFYGVESQVLHPVLYLDDFKMEKVDRKYITFINPIKFKGAEIVIKIAKELPDQPFLVVGGKRNEYVKHFESLKNVKYLPWCDNMKKVYAQTKLLLVPSLWPEPFGRVALEAQINGIPVVGNNTGGIPEAIEKGGTIIKDTYNIDLWVKSIKNIIDPKKYTLFSKYAEEHAIKFKKEHQLKIIKTHLKGLNI